jgi:hypothetical protein
MSPELRPYKNGKPMNDREFNEWYEDRLMEVYRRMPEDSRPIRDLGEYISDGPFPGACANYRGRG